MCCRRTAQSTGEGAGADAAVCAATKKELSELSAQHKSYAEGEAARIAKFEEERIKREKKVRERITHDSVLSGDIFSY